MENHSVVVHPFLSHPRICLDKCTVLAYYMQSLLTESKYTLMTDAYSKLQKVFVNFIPLLKFSAISET